MHIYVRASSIFDKHTETGLLLHHDGRSILFCFFVEPIKLSRIIRNQMRNMLSSLAFRMEEIFYWDVFHIKYRPDNPGFDHFDMSWMIWQ